LIGLLSPLVPARIVIASLTWGTFGILTFAYIRLIGRSLDKLTPLLLVGLLFLPSLLPFYLYDHGAFGRKEIIGFLILLWHLYLLEAPGNRVPTQYVRKLIPLSVIALPVHVLIHEASFFLFVPAHLFISHAIIRQAGSVGPYSRLFTLLLLYLLVCLSFLAVSLFGSPTFKEALDICMHWELLGEFEPEACLSDGKIISLSNYTPVTSFMTLPWTLSEAAVKVMSFPLDILLSWVLTSLILGFCTLYIGSLVIDALWRGKATRSFDPTALAAPRSAVQSEILFCSFIWCPRPFTSWARISGVGSP